MGKKGIYILFLSFFIYLNNCSPLSKSEENQWRYYYDLGMSAYYSKNFSEATANLHKAARVRENEPIIWNALGQVYMEVGEWKKAEKSLSKALEIDKNFTDARLNLGILYLKTKRYKEAERYLKEAIEDETFEKKHIAYFYMAKLKRELDDKEGYLRNLKKATAYNPMFIEAQMELGSAYIEIKEYEKAEKVYLSLLNNNFKYPSVYLSLARVYIDMAKYDLAKEMIREVFESKQTNELQRKEAYDLLSKILVIEQHQKMGIKKTEEIQRKIEGFKNKKIGKRREMKEGVIIKKGGTIKPKKKIKGRYGIQVGAFSSKKKAKSMVEKLKKFGFENVFIHESSGIYKVIYGGFKTKREAREKLRILKKINIYGFIVDME